MPKAKTLKADERKQLLDTLQDRFEANPKRHPGIDWDDVRARLEAAGGRLPALLLMERTGGEPDVVGRDRRTGGTSSPNAPGRARPGGAASATDRAALEKRKENKRRGSAVAMAAAMGVDLMTEEDYRALQAKGACDNATRAGCDPPRSASWESLRRPPLRPRCSSTTTAPTRNYAARGFRGTLRI